MLPVRSIVYGFLTYLRVYVLISGPTCSLDTPCLKPFRTNTFYPLPVKGHIIDKYLPQFFD